MGQLDADWYIADRMGKMLAANPDLHTETLLARIPTAVKNPLEAHFWLPSVSWVFDFGEPVPEISGAQSSLCVCPLQSLAHASACLPSISRCSLRECGAEPKRCGRLWPA